MAVSTLTEDPLEDVAAEFGDTPGFFQLYTPTDRDLAASLVSRAEAAGYKAIIVTLDTWIPGWRPRDLATSNFPQLRGRCLANYTSDPVFRASLAQPPEENMQAAVLHWVQLFGNPLTWEDLPWLRSLTDLPLILKGVLHPEDALAARAAGMDGVIVSNHGGRQVDGSVAAIDALAGVVDAVGAHMDVLFDSGIRRGTDVLKAIALGADAVLVGRPFAWGLACAGEQGVAEVLRRLLADIDLSLALIGQSRIDRLSRASLAPAPR